MSKKTAIVTGATGGLGEEFVKCLLKEDIDEIWSIARNKEKLTKLREKYGEKIIPISQDISSIEGINKLSEMLDEKKPDITYLINNAGLARMAPVTEFSPKEIDDTINLNCKTPMLLTNVCLKYMNRGSHVLNISSAASFQPTPYINLYASTKVFLTSYSRAMNVELKGRGICVTAVCPSWVDTPLIPKTLNGKTIDYPGIATADMVAKKAMKDAKKNKDISVYSFYVKCQQFFVKFMTQKHSMKLWTNGLKKYDYKM